MPKERIEIANVDPKDKMWLDIYMTKNRIKSRRDFLSLVIKALKDKKIKL